MMESRMTPRFCTSGEGEVEQPSIIRARIALSATDSQKQRPLVDRHERVPRAGPITGSCLQTVRSSGSLGALI